MELILQPTPETCGQACIAMITGKKIEEVIKDMKTSGPTSIGQLIEILEEIRVSPKRILYRTNILSSQYIPMQDTPIGHCFMITNIMIPNSVSLKARIRMEK